MNLDRLATRSWRLSEQLGSQLRSELERQGMSQVDLANAMGLSAKHINHMVHGKSGALAMYDFAAFTLGCEWSVTLAEQSATDQDRGMS